LRENQENRYGKKLYRSNTSADDYHRHNDALTTQFKAFIPYKQYYPHAYRYSQHSNYTVSLISATSLRIFWSSTMLLPARFLWYHVFCKKLPTSASLYSIGTSRTTRCRLCRTSYDSIDHFLVNCPHKHQIWSEIIHTYLS
ncbi:MAG: hypothetical protein EXX96DRAFT_452151, partial [Benjaminiella poitrasii]